VSGSTLLAPVRPVAPVLTLPPGRVVGLIGPAGSGLTRVGLSLLARPSRTSMVVTLDVRGWLSPLAAWEMGISPDRLVVVRCPDHRLWPQVAAALLEGVPAVYAEVPVGVRDQDLRRLAALARARRTGLVMRPLKGDLPAGVTHLRLRGRDLTWEGTAAGSGRLNHRRIRLEVSGTAVGGIERLLALKDDGIQVWEEEDADIVCVVPGLAFEAAGGFAG
jgi:hypothetical protein